MNTSSEPGKDSVKSIDDLMRERAAERQGVSQVVATEQRTNPPAADKSVTVNFGSTSRVFCVLGGLASIGGGIYLASITAFSQNSLLAAIANGIGWYCIGKGIFMMAVPFQTTSVAAAMVRALRR